MNENSTRPKLGLLEMIKSVLWALLGVQSEQNRQRDFQHGKPVHFIVIGLIATVVFIFCIWLLVRLAMHLA